MGQRNMLCTNQIIDLEMDQQGQGYLYPGPSIHLGATANFPQPNMRTMVTATRNTANFDTQYLPERHDNAMFYGMTQYNTAQHHHNLDLGMTAPANFYYPYITPSSSAGVLPVPLNAVGISADDYGRNANFVDDVRGPCKRKTPEGFPGNYQHYNASASHNSSMLPLNARHPDGVAVMDAASFSLPPYIGTGNPSVIDVGPQSGVRNRLGASGLDSVLTHDHNHLNQGNYMSQHFQPTGTLWLEQHISSSSGDPGASAWNQAPSIPFVHGGNVSVGSLETANMGMARYHETATGRSSQGMRHPSSGNHRLQNHHPSPSMQGPRGHNIHFHPQVAASSFRISSNSSRNIMNSSQNLLEVGHRQSGTVPPTGFRISRPNRGVIPENALRHQNLPHLRLFQADEVAILEIPDLYEVGNFTDHHRDMRLDIEDMTYEELLALGERIGNVSTGLSEDAIIRQLKLRTYFSSSTTINLEEAEWTVKEAEACIICQDEYKNMEKIGTLKCGHEYHAECLKKWLLIKNVCPICKSEALGTGRNDL
ncbi:probable E3 ubiquitin-protein ligase ZFP1 isoform X1 [Ziziphus jujuba]|uniref:RING-type E3 ubiquitin transferase n=1 Tax=Ziziphus jujuba TaxID=326968 RepID=A0A6P4BA49_ZIZJJ|nr:probable E3 ubiquitin-protein ligase ZFP1 isoform X1 [Ziziphus jujuba]XP_015899194.2 probable E3 ubiquitin-protein ligase ZFP1 isoform X1 [Ziziphus jujuba]